MIVPRVQETLYRISWPLQTRRVCSTRHKLIRIYVSFETISCWHDLSAHDSGTRRTAVANIRHDNGENCDGM